MIITTGGHTVEFTGNTMNAKGEYNIKFVNGKFKTVKIDGFDLITCYEENGGLFLHHLEVPETRRGFGKLGLALFYALCKKLDYSKYTIKFGGGEESKYFLINIGFTEDNIAVVQDTDYVISSVVVGNVKNSEDIYGWEVDHQHISKYPTGFFSIR